MLVAERTRLADTVDRWLQRQRVSKVHLTKFGGISANTLWLIQQGTTTSPEMETLRKIAKGLATDPYSKDMDREVYLEAWRDLAAAAGHPDPTQEIPPADLDSEIRAIIPNRRRAAAIAEFVRRYPDMTPDQRRMVDAVIDGIARLGEKP